MLGWTFRGGLEEFEAALRLGDRLPERQRCLARAFVEGFRTSLVAMQAMHQECAARFHDDKLIQLLGGDFPYHRGDAAGAVPYMERALALDPTYATAAEHLSTALQELGQVQKQAAVARAFAETVHTPLAEDLVAFSQEVAGETDQAARTSRRAAELFPQSAEPSLRLATGMLFRQDPNAAEAELRPVLARIKVPAERDAISQALIRIDAFRGRYRAVIAALGTAAEAFIAAGKPHEAAQNLFWQALVQAVGTRDPAAARRTLERLRAVEPDFDCVAIPADLGDADGAAACDTGNERFTDLWIAALRARQAGRQAESLSRYQQLARVPYLGAQMRFTLAQVQLDAGRPQEAIATLKRLQSTYPGVRVLYWDLELWLPQSFYLLGVAEERAGETAAARSAYGRFLSLWKDADPELKELQEAKAAAARLR